MLAPIFGSPEFSLRVLRLCLLDDMSMTEFSMIMGSVRMLGNLEETQLKDLLKTVEILEINCVLNSHFPLTLGKFSSLKTLLLTINDDQTQLINLPKLEIQKLTLTKLITYQNEISEILAKFQSLKNLIVNCQILVKEKSTLQFPQHNSLR